MLWNQGVHTDIEVTTNRSDIISKTKKEKMCILIDVKMPADRNVLQKQAEKKQIQVFKYRNIVNVEHEIYDYAGNNWSHWKSNKRFKVKFWKPCQENIQ